MKVLSTNKKALQNIQILEGFFVPNTFHFI